MHMDRKDNKTNKQKLWMYFILAFLCFYIILKISNSIQTNKNSSVSFDKLLTSNNKSISIIASQENYDEADILKDYCNSIGVNINIDFAGTLDIMSRLNSGEKYDAVWISNSIWLYMLNSDIVTTTESKSTCINPVIFGIKKSKANELGFIGKDVYTKDIVEAIQSNKLKFTMPSPTQTNTGATAYLGLLSTLAGNPEVLTKENLDNPELKANLTNFFTNMERSSGDEDFLEKIYLNGNYEAVVTYEKSIINLNKDLIKQGKEPLYAVYPVDGVSISDSPIALINKDKKDIFLKIRQYLLSDEGQQKLLETGRRTWYGGINKNVDKTIFNPDWGIDTSKYIVPIKYPSTSVIMDALNMYQNELRKPVHIVFCLDISGSMYGNGIKQLQDAMNTILSKEKASKDLIQFTNKDKIGIITFNQNVSDIYEKTDGTDTSDLIQKINNLEAYGGTNIYDASAKGLEILSDEDINTYNSSIILMTDGYSNSGDFNSLKNVYTSLNKDIPIYSIMFGDSSSSQLNQIASLTNARVFDGTKNLIKAFKVVRGYN